MMQGCPTPSTKETIIKRVGSDLAQGFDDMPVSLTFVSVTREYHPNRPPMGYNDGVRGDALWSPYPTETLRKPLWKPSI